MRTRWIAVLVLLAGIAVGWTVAPVLDAQQTGIRRTLVMRGGADDGTPASRAPRRPVIVRESEDPWPRSLPPR
jgi:hypothetical protein